jgi:hypothetical protein
MGLSVVRARATVAMQPVEIASIDRATQLNRLKSQLAAYGTIPADERRPASPGAVEGYLQDKNLLVGTPAQRDEQTVDVLRALQQYVDRESMSIRRRIDNGQPAENFDEAIDLLNTGFEAYARTASLLSGQAQEKDQRKADDYGDYLSRPQNMQR